jgi:hypothetical protein
MPENKFCEKCPLNQIQDPKLKQAALDNGCETMTNLIKSDTEIFMSPTVSQILEDELAIVRYQSGCQLKKITSIINLYQDYTNYTIDELVSQSL